MSQKSASSKQKPSKIVLKNGLEVRLVPSRKSPVVSVQIWVKTGSADERRPEEGISHFIEHLLFKGTEKYDVGEIARTVEASGGELNAWTSFDQTVFYVNISREFQDIGLDVIAEMMGCPRFDPKEIDAEREVVLEEIKRTNDSPSRKGSRLLFSSIYKKHPYRLPVIGRPEVIKKVTPAAIRRYFNERYAPKNMTLVIAGDFETAAMGALVRARFGALAANAVRKVPRAKEPKSISKVPRVYCDSADVKEMQLHFSWPIPSVKHEDVAALETLAMVLGQGDASRVVRRLRVESDVVNSAGAGCFTSRDAGFFTVTAHLNAKRLTEVLPLLNEEIVGLLERPASGEEIERAIVNIESSELYGLETADGLARKIGSLTTLLGDPSEMDNYLMRVRRFSSEQAVKIAKKYLSPEKLSVVCLAPLEVDKKQLKAQLAAAAKAYGQRWRMAKVGKMPKKKKSAKRAVWAARADGAIEIESRTLKSGVRVVARIARSTPVVSARIGFLGGSRLEPANQDGLTELLSRTWLTGTAELSETDLNAKVEGLAAGLGAFGGRHTAGISGQVLSEYESQLIPLFFETAFRPAISSEAVEREKAMMLESLRTREDRPAQVGSRLFMEALFEGHPYARDPMGTAETITAFSRAQLEEFHHRIIRPKDAVFVLTGNADVDAWCEALSHIPQAQPKAEGFKKFPLTSTLGADAFRFHELKKEQTHIMVGWRGLTLADPRRYALQVAQAVLAGQGGRLFLELRDKKSLAYSVGPTSMEGVDSGYFGAFIGCAPEKGETAIAMMRAEIEKLATTPIPQVELDRAIRYLIGSHDLGLQKASAVSSALLFNEIYGIPGEEVFRYADRVRAVRAEDVRELIAGIIKAPSVTVAVGSRAPWAQSGGSK